jgi:acyl carrier protein
MTEVSGRIRTLASDILLLPVERIPPSASPETVAGWDSVQHLTLILALEQEFDVQFEPEEIAQLTSIGRIEAVVVEKLSGGA